MSSPKLSLKSQPIGAGSIRKLKDKKYFLIQQLQKIKELEQLKKKLEQLEWYYQTTPLNAKKEEEVLKQIAELAKQVSILSKQLKLKDVSIISIAFKKASLISSIQEIDQEISKIKKKKNELFERALEKYKQGVKLDFYEYSILVERGIVA